MAPKCRHGCDFAHVRVVCSGGCACFPNDRIQDLCIQHWIKMEPLGKDNYVLLVLDQVLAAKLLWGEFANWGFYEWEGSHAFFRTDEGKLIRAHEATREQLDRRRDSWLGKEFKFDIPSPPKVGGQLLDFHYI